MSVKLDRKQFNKKIRRLKNVATYEFETGLHDPEQARKGRLLDEGDSPKQVARPWFTNNMRPQNRDLRFLVEAGLTDIYTGKMTAAHLARILTDYCRLGLDDSSLPPLREYTLLVKAGILKRPQTGRRRQSIGPAEDIGRDSGKMVRNIRTKVTRKRKK